MKICLLQNDQLDDTVAPQFHSYAAMFQRLFHEAGANWAFDVFDATLGQYPESFDAYDAVLLTGSRHDAFSDAPWVRALRDQVKALLQSRKKLLGVCFGHQLIAHVAGAPVARASQGWGAGRMLYRWHAAGSDAGAERGLALLASHQDQVMALPEGADLLASSAFCPIAAYRIADSAFCVQAHPEFTEEYSAYLLQKRRAQLGEVAYAAAMDDLRQGHDGAQVARMMIDFVEGRQGRHYLVLA
jgi:GMP synthase-like glutamine amidotransferase